MFRILIVDDEHIILNGCSFMISDTLNLPFPVEVLTASNVPQAMEALEKQLPDLILSDIRMPVMDGFALIDYVRKLQQATDIVILTSHADFEYARKALRYGVNDFILKPIDENVLRDTILNAYRRKQESEETLKNSHYMKLLTMLLYDVSATDLLLTEELLRGLFPYTYFTVAVISAGSIPDSPDSVEALFNQYYQKCRCYLLHERKQIIVICNSDTFFVRCGALQDKLYQLLGTSFYLGSSISSSSVHQLPQLYGNACQRIFYKKVFGENQSLIETACFSYHDTVQVFNENEEERRRVLLFDFLDRLKLVDTPSDSYWSQVYTSFFQNIVLYLEHIGIMEEIDIPVRAERQLHGQDALAEEIVSGISKVKEQLKAAHPDTGSESLTNQLLDFIKAHYQDDISLNDLSDAVGLHPNYVCSFFKKATGSSYLTFLHKERISAAKKLLAETDIPIENVARQAGYNSSNQFSRIFRKYEGVSPSDFRGNTALHTALPR